MADVDDEGNVTCYPKPAELRLIGGTPRIGIGQHFAADHLWAARLVAHLCRQHEDQLLSQATPVVDYHVRSFALAAISESVALLEAHVNGIWQDAADFGPADDRRLRGLSPKARVKMRELWTERFERKKALHKYKVALDCAGETLDTRRREYQDVDAVIRLRDALVHFHPGMNWTDEPHDIEIRVKHLVPENPLMRDTAPWFPNHPLCAGVAQWAWQSCMRFADDCHEQMGLQVSYRDGMVAWPDGLP
jgi:hypothetical protein